METERVLTLTEPQMGRFVQRLPSTGLDFFGGFPGPNILPPMDQRGPDYPRTNGSDLRVGKIRGDTVILENLNISGLRDYHRELMGLYEEITQSDA